MRYSSLLTLFACPLFAGQPLEIRFDSLPSGGKEVSSAKEFGASDPSLASNWESRAQPVGNGRIGAMVAVHLSLHQKFWEAFLSVAGRPELNGSAWCAGRSGNRSGNYRMKHRAAIEVTT